MLKHAALAEIGALSAHLEMQVLRAQVALVASCVGEAVVAVIFLNEVLANSARLPDGQGGVGVFDGGDAAVRVDVDERRFLDLVKTKGINGVV